MSHLNFLASSFFQVFFGFILFEYIACECTFPDAFPDGKFIYKSPSNANKSLAEDLCLLKFECSHGFHLIGSPYVMCVDEEWVPAIPFCAKMVCSKPPDVRNAMYEVKPEVTEFQIVRSRAVYTCHEGYVLNDTEHTSLFCVLSRKSRKAVWRGKTPSCIERMSCSDPGVSNFGSRKGECCKYGTSLEFNCNEGYELVGESIIHCLPSGNWTSHRPLCKPLEDHCELPPIIPHGHVIGVKKGDYFVPHEEAKVLCDSGYKYEGPDSVFCEEEGEWESEFGKCKEIRCDPPPLIANGTILELKSSNLTSFPYNFNLTYVCDNNYRLIGDSRRICRRRGWSGKPPTCERWNDLEDLSKPEEKERETEQNSKLRKILYFIFDVSRGIGLQNFRKSIILAKALVNKVGISEDGTRAGAITFSSKANHMFLPHHFINTEDVLDALDKIEFTGRGTNIRSAFTLFRSDSVPIVNEVLGAKNIKYSIFLFTDGKANMGGSPEYEAETLKRMGMDIYCIGITGDVRTDILYAVASKSINANGEEYAKVYILKNYASMLWLAQEIINGSIDYSECGLGLESISTFHNVRGTVGSQISIEPWPWMAALFKEFGEESPAKYEFFCSGTIIHQNFILTAAHCLYRIERGRYATIRSKKSIIIKLGLTDFKNEIYMQEFGVKEIFLHPQNQVGDFFDYDIALLQIEKPAQYNAFVRPICLPPRELPDVSPLYQSHSPAWAAGWFRDEPVTVYKNVKSTQTLTQIYLPIQPKDLCIASLREKMNVSYFTDRMFCAGEGTGGRDICAGGSGGPLMQSQSNNEGYMYWTQVGIVSWGIGCGIPGTYGYYTHVQSFIPWIDETIENALKNVDT